MAFEALYKIILEGEYNLQDVDTILRNMKLDELQKQRLTHLSEAKQDTALLKLLFRRKLFNMSYLGVFGSDSTIFTIIYC